MIIRRSKLRKPVAPRVAASRIPEQHPARVEKAPNRLDQEHRRHGPGAIPRPDAHGWGVQIQDHGLQSAPNATIAGDRMSLSGHRPRRPLGRFEARKSAEYLREL